MFHSFVPVMGTVRFNNAATRVVEAWIRRTVFTVRRIQESFHHVLCDARSFGLIVPLANETYNLQGAPEVVCSENRQSHVPNRTTRCKWGAHSYLTVCPYSNHFLRLMHPFRAALGMFHTNSVSGCTSSTVIVHVGGRFFTFWDVLDRLCGNLHLF